MVNPPNLEPVRVDAPFTPTGVNSFAFSAPFFIMYLMSRRDVDFFTEKEINVRI